jgi:hypothetical protein
MAPLLSAVDVRALGRQLGSLAGIGKRPLGLLDFSLTWV